MTPATASRPICPAALRAGSCRPRWRTCRSISARSSPTAASSGSHAVVILSDKDDMKAVALNLMRFFEDESCGQCTPCRVGTEKAVKLMANGPWDEALLNELSAAMRDASICGLGQAAPNPLTSVFRYFPRRPRQSRWDLVMRSCVNRACCGAVSRMAADTKAPVAVLRDGARQRSARLLDEGARTQDLILRRRAAPLERTGGWAMSLAAVLRDARYAGSSGRGVDDCNMKKTSQPRNA